MNDFFAPPPPEIFRDPVKGIVESAISLNFSGRIKYQGSYWEARFYRPSATLVIPPKKTVNVVGIQGLTLLVIPEGDY
ncbi:NfeD family protein [Oscillatoria sp. FACHB-1407]|uniref:NfeD family protein n=1 Tax=Oscillatoria sp. FACHB-1407 TaxID=2692847 RepID=UPI0016878725|nr:NfeD family protein [Oscillatoria sp. FACHB-1407]MBD2465338.1 NfeD family protein [Oscillatoria sp. FACHB-1407]